MFSISIGRNTPVPCIHKNLRLYNAMNFAWLGSSSKFELKLKKSYLFFQILKTMDKNMKISFQKITRKYCWFNEFKSIWHKVNRNELLYLPNNFPMARMWHKFNFKRTEFSFFLLDWLLNLDERDRFALLLPLARGRTDKFLSFSKNR